jgi:hypothetical protein
MPMRLYHGALRKIYPATAWREQMGASEHQATHVTDRPALPGDWQGVGGLPCSLSWAATLPVDRARLTQMTAVATLTSALTTGPVTWHTIDWYAVHRTVRRLQARIVQAVQAGRWGKVRALQHLLTHSFIGKALAVQRVTTNAGKKTPGVDGQVWDTPEKKARAIRALRQRGYRARSGASTFRRVMARIASALCRSPRCMTGRCKPCTCLPWIPSRRLWAIRTPMASVRSVPPPVRS